MGRFKGEAAVAKVTAAYVIVLRHDVSVVPIAAAVMTTMETLREGWTRARSGERLSRASSRLVASVWFRTLTDRSAIDASRKSSVPA